MNIKALLVLIGFVVYSLITGNYILCTVKEKCDFSIINRGVEESDENAVSFAYEGYDALTGNNFDAVKLDLLTQLGETNKLKIKGLYSPSEANTSGNVDLGIARAISFRKLFPEIEDGRFILTSKEVPIDESLAKIDAVEWNVLINNEYVEEIENAVVIHFSTNDEEGILNSEIEEYLTILAEKHSLTDKYLDVVGHSDNQGDAGDNFTLALNRANSIKDMLVGKGLSNERVNVTSKGETEPIADNGTEEGRAKNRRVEILIN